MAMRTVSTRWELRPSSKDTCNNRGILISLHGHRGKEPLNWLLAYPDKSALWAIQIECDVDRNAHQQDEADHTSNVGTSLDALLTADQQRGDDRAGIKQEHDAAREAVPVSCKPRGLVAGHAIEGIGQRHCDRRPFAECLLHKCAHLVVHAAKSCQCFFEVLGAGSPATQVEAELFVLPYYSL